MKGNFRGDVAYITRRTQSNVEQYFQNMQGLYWTWRSTPQGCVRK